jgi:hypothetical protein
MTPRTLKIRGHIFKVKQVPKKALRGNLADIDTDSNTIRIPRSATQTVKVELLFHEISHALLAGSGLEEKEEEVATALGEALTAFLWDNPAFIRHALQVLSN